MRYKAIMLDIDGTIVPYDYEALPSDKLVQSIKSIENRVNICFVTGRSYPFLKPVLKKFGIKNGYSVVNNGAHVIKLTTEELFYHQPITQKDASVIYDILEKENIVFYIKQGLYDDDYIEHPYKKGMEIKEASMIFTEEFYMSQHIDAVHKQLLALHNISIYKSRHKDGFGLNIQHSKATKLHGVEVLLKALHITSQEVIGVGDGYNDFPLLMACGLKVAMGNAIEDLKQIADYVAPSVDEEGVAHVIEKFILKTT